MRFRKAAAGLAVGSGLAFAVAAHAQEPVDAVIPVNTVAPAYPSAGAVVGMDAAGNFVVVWTSDGHDGSGQGIAARRYDPTGIPLGPEFQVNTVTGGDQRAPSVAMAASGDFVVVWQGDGAGGAPTGIFAQRYDAAGQAAGAEFQVNAVTTRPAALPDVAADVGGGFVVTWEGYTPGTAGWDVFARRFDATGAAAAPEFRVNASTTGEQRGSSVGVDAAGTMVVAWERTTTVQQQRQAAYRRFDVSGTPLTADRVVDGASDQPGTDVAMAPDGSFVFVWGSGRIWGRAFDAAGTPRSNRFAVTGDRSWDPSVAFHPDGTGEFLVSWTAADRDVAAGMDVRFRPEVASFDRAGRRASPAYRAGPETATPIGPSAVGVAGIEHMVTAWSGADAATADVFARRLAAGRLTGTVRHAVTAAPLPNVLIGVGSAVAGWTDAFGRYAVLPPEGVYDMSAGADQFVTTYAVDVPITRGAITVRDFALVPVPRPDADGYAVDDSGPGGNGNGAVDPNERFLLTLFVLNRGAGPATSISATLSSSTPGVTLAQPSAGYPDLAAGARAGGLAPFELITAPDFPVGQEIRLRLDLTAAQGTFVLNYTLTTGLAAPPLSFDAPLPVNIPDLARIGANVRIPVAGVVGAIRSFAVSMHVTHPNVQDLRLSLVGPDNMAVALAFQLAAGANLGTDCPADGNDTTFGLPATHTIAESAPPYIGTFALSQNIARWVGKSSAVVNGVWRLQAIDQGSPGQFGRFECARLVIYPTLPATGGHVEVAIAGTVTDTFTGAPVAGATVATPSGFSTVTDADGHYRLDLLPGTLDVTASKAGHTPATAPGVVVTSGTQVVNLSLVPLSLAASLVAVDDAGPGGNGNGVVDRDERFELSVTLANTGATGASAVSATLSPDASGVTALNAISSYPDIVMGASAANLTAFALQTTADFAAGSALVLSLTVNTTQGTVTVPVVLPAGTPTGLMAEATAGGPVPITDDKVAPATLPIVVPAMAGPVSRVVVQARVAHPTPQHMVLMLESPDGTRIRLADRLLATPPGTDYGTDCPADGNDTTFDDAAPGWIGAAPAPRAGTFRPDQPLATFRGKTGTGTWKLSAYNDDPARVVRTAGQLECVRLLLDGYAGAEAADVIFADGFESGDLSAWDGGSTNGGDLRASAAAALDGTFGLEAVVNDTQALYVRDLSPTDESRYRARFRFDPNGFDPGEATAAYRVILFIGLEEAPARRLVQVILKRRDGIYSVMGRVDLDDGTFVDTVFMPVSDAPHVIELDWRKASAPVAPDGSFHLSVDGVAAPPLTGLDNGAHALDFLRLGAMAVKAGASGSMHFDRFESRRAGAFGP